MRLSHTHEFIFFSNPKTGSESVRKLLDPYSDVAGVPMWQRTEEQPFYTHIKPVEVREILNERGFDYDEYFTFTFVRNPWARMVSLYEMIFGDRREYGLTGRLPKLVRNALRIHPSPAGFRKWLRSVRPYGPGAGGPSDQRWRVYGTYNIQHYAGDGEGNLIVDQIIRLEDINIALPRLLSEIGLPESAGRSVPRVNSRRHATYETYYDDDAIELVRRRYEYEIERFGYRFAQ